MNIALWIAQALLAATLIWSGMIKLLQPVAELSAMWPWAAQVPFALVKFTGIVDLLGAFGLTLPALFHIRSKITPIAALGIIVLMVCASVFHISRGEASSIAVNIFFAIIAAFIAWGRSGAAVIKAK